MRTRFSALLALGLVALVPAAARSQTSGFTGRYALKIAFGASCRAAVASVTIQLTFRQSPVSAGIEADGRPVLAGDEDVAQVLLLYSTTRVHGPFATKGSRTDREPITTSEGLLVAPWLMLDGTVTAGSGRPQAKGTAFGYTAVGTASEDTPSSLVSCTAADFSWTLDPQ